ncbi:hypothetical protein CASFOL_009803 [Castilleja foliolosa]|uniref:DNL-type domain-containing protein n=1 Tax=Castilleja foliolosa TaxID=1961234 RepID=A0ABD3DQP9_9LAMI
MAAINSCKIPGFNNKPIKIKAPISLISYPQFFRANHGASCEAFKLPRLRINPRNKAPVQCLKDPRISCLFEDNCEEYKETEHSQQAATDLKLPRRSLLVNFTCDACGVRSQRLINRLAYERGLVYVQCSGCSQYHKLVDNLGLVVEYKLQDEIDLDANTDRA